MVKKEFFGKTKDGKDVDLYTLDNGKMNVKIMTLGGIIKNINVPNKDGKLIDIAIGLDTVDEYETRSSYFGAAIGRVGNRIKDGKFTLNGVDYQLSINDGKNSLHGGKVGFDQKIWKVLLAEDVDGVATLKMTIDSPDGEEGFPGNLTIVMTYSLSEDNSFAIRYEGETDKDTLVNMTNHTYFNIAGHDSGTIYDTVLFMNSSFYTPNTDACMPYGEVLAVDGTPFDFRTPKKIGTDINSDYEQLKMFGGYDHNFLFDGEGMRYVAFAESEKSGIKMEMYTDLPGVQLYTSNALDEGDYKGGAHYVKHQAFCLETQYTPNAINYAHYKAPILRKGEKYDTTTIYKFV